MKKILLITLLSFGLILPVYAGKLSTSVKLMGNAIFINESGDEYIIPIFNLTGIYTDKDDKKYYMHYYGFYSESGKRSQISKADYEKLKRLLMKTEQ